MVLIVEILLLVFMLGVIGYIVFGIIADLKAAPYVPSSKSKRKTIKKFLEEVRKRHKGHNPKQLKFIDLGSGSGTIVFEAAELGFDAVGIEYSPYLVWTARLRAKLCGLNNADFKRADLFSANLSEYDVVFSYLMPKAMKKLEKKLENELKPGAVFIAESFKLPNKKPSKVENRVYFYE